MKTELNLMRSIYGKEPAAAPGVHTFILGAEGADGAIARGEAPQRGAQPRERRMPAEHAPRGAADSLP